MAISLENLRVKFDQLPEKEVEERKAFVVRENYCPEIKSVTERAFCYYASDYYRAHGGGGRMISLIEATRPSPPEK
ncbi:MAG: hypothetical protein P0S96_03575 [Simkaniaceae bacterium]|nr:hypothetical protein [Candidatus Sacchlamyda saccharinae]